MINFDKRVWKQAFVSNEHHSAWRCGKCGIGSLHLLERIKHYSYAHSGVLRCTNTRCGMGYQVMGILKPTAFGHEVTPSYYGVDDYNLYPSQFLPELAMFELPITVLESIKVVLIKSFNHFWYDKDACANKIRQAIELIVDSKGGVGKTLDAKIKSIESNLGARLTQMLLALKWIGNDGSHAGRPFTLDETLDAYSILIDVLNQLYPDESEETRRESLVQLINEKRGLKNL